MTTSAAGKKQRPKYLSLPALLFEIRLPLAGRVSILHRVSGVLLFFPFAAWLLFMLDESLASEQGFQQVEHYLGLRVVKIGLIVFIWAFCHHLCAGVRFFFLDIDKGVDLKPSRISAVLVLVVSLAMTAFFALKLW